MYTGRMSDLACSLKSSTTVFNAPMDVIVSVPDHDAVLLYMAVSSAPREL